MDGEKVVFTENLSYPVSIQRTGSNKYTITYGKQVETNLNWPRAVKSLGECIAHSLCCMGKFDRK